MTKLTTAEVKHISGLANLKLNKREIQKYKIQLSSVISFIGKLSEIDVSKIKLTRQTGGLFNVSREDKINSGEMLSVDEALSGKDNTYNGYFRVKGILVKE